MLFPFTVFSVLHTLLVASIQPDVILGTDFLTQNKASINFHAQQFSMGGVSVPFVGGVADSLASHSVPLEGTPPLPDTSQLTEPELTSDCILLHACFNAC